MVIILGAAVYWPVVHLPFLWDDHQMITKNKFITGWTWTNLKHSFASDAFNTGSTYYRPLATLANISDFSIWKLRPFGFHLTNLFLHLFNAILILCFFKLLTKNTEVSFLISILFLLHPLQLSSVAYIANRNTLLSSLLMLSGLIIFFRRNQAGWGWSLLLFFLALLAKESSIIFPLLILLVYLFKNKDDKIIFTKNRLDRQILKILPFFLLSFLYLFFRWNFWEKTFLQFNLKEIFHLFLLKLPQVLLDYFVLIIFPFNLHSERKIPDYGLYLSILITGLILTLVYLIWRVKNKNVQFGLFWFAIALLPNLPVLSKENFMFEHWLYLAVPGLFFVFSSLLFNLLNSKNKPATGIAVILTLFLIIFYGLMVRYNLKFWQDETLFFQRIIKFSPTTRTIHNLGYVYLEKGEINEAITCFEKAVKADPTLENLNSLAVAYKSAGKTEQGINILKKIIKTDPANELAWLNLGMFYLNQNNYLLALEAEAKVLEINPDSETAYYNLGEIYRQKKDFLKAKENYRKAILINPYLVTARDNLAALYAEENNLSEAVYHWQFVLQFSPTDRIAQQNLKKALIILKKVDEGNKK